MSRKKKIRDAVVACAISLAAGLRCMRSSRRPIIKGMINTGSKRMTMDDLGSILQHRQPIVKPKKIATPPSEGVIFLWILLGPGTATTFLFLEKRMTNGRNAKETRKDVTPAKKGVKHTLEKRKIRNYKRRVNFSTPADPPW